MKKLLSVPAMVLALSAALGAAVAGDQYDLSVTAPAAKVNERAVAKVSLAPKGAYHVNTEYPVKLKMTAPDGVTLDKDTLKGPDAKRFEKAGLDFEVAFTAAASGKKSFAGELKFAVCTDTDCKPVTEKVALYGATVAVACFPAKEKSIRCTGLSVVAVTVNWLLKEAPGAGAVNETVR